MDLSQITEHSFTRKRGADGYDYYEILYKLEWVYHSRTTTFTIIHDGKSPVNLSNTGELTNDNRKALRHRDDQICLDGEYDGHFS